MRIFVPILLCVTLAGCGSKEAEGLADLQNEALGPGNQSSSQSADVDLGTADLQRLNCAAVNARRGEGADVVGVTIGMPAEQAFEKIACSNPQLMVEYRNSGGFGLPPLPDGRTPRTMIVSDGGQDQFEVSLVGLPGNERVVAVQRTLTFAVGEESTMTALVEQLQGKYGQLSRSPYDTRSFVGGSVRSSDGRTIDPSEASLFHHCLPSTSGSVSLAGDCGLSVGVRIDPKNDNPQLARRLVVTMTHGSYGMRLIQEFNDFVSNAARQQAQEEVNSAAGRRPTL